MRLYCFFICCFTSQPWFFEVTCVGEIDGLFLSSLLVLHFSIMHEDERGQNATRTSLGQLLNLDIKKVDFSFHDDEMNSEHSSAVSTREDAHDMSFGLADVSTASSPRLLELKDRLETEERAKSERENTQLAKRRSEDEEVRDYLYKLDALRLECVERQMYKKAQLCLDRMREVNLLYARKVEAESQKINVAVVARVRQRHELEEVAFREAWRERLTNFDQARSEKLQTMREELREGMAEEEEELRLHFRRNGTLLHYSKRVLQLENDLSMFVSKGLYMEADKAKRAILVEKRKEEESHRAALARQFAAAVKSSVERYEAEYAMVKDKMEQDRRELCVERETALSRLRKSHASALARLEKHSQALRRKAKSYIDTQLNLYLSDPLKFGVELTSLSDLLMGV
ncbi:trichoplein, keratin filament binding protein [Angomonas deanei]|uniref:Uncharacterized protein n=1 Tax=Angomonas deanei TaxID=59799 RepID=A0A7G2CGB7_9TRYP|nr:trichoplein, keratin filament binding protein [Angomonas deanei]CAD2218928.1 hypothetical protein, conserved [Angomonas deanei]|eukprot:EPY23459.1 trichoplein, keratin filament binding protein [Angomonas deanei]